MSDRASGGRSSDPFRLQLATKWLLTKPLLVLTVVGVVFLAFGLRQAWLDSPTYDEPVYMAAGVTALVDHDLRLNPEHPPLAKVLAAVPALFAHPVIPGGRAWAQADEGAYSVQFVQAQLHAGKLRLVTFLSRLVPLAETIAIGFAMFALARRLFGRNAGLLAGILWLADPLVLGLGHLDGVDVPLTLTAVLVGWALLNALRATGLRQLVVLGAACAAAILSKDTGILVAASAAAVVVAAGWRSERWRALGRLVPVLGAAWVLTLACYLVIDPSSLLPYVVVPKPYVDGLRFLLGHDTNPSPAYLVGIFWTGGRWWYWPISLVVKVPLVTVALLVATPFSLRWASSAARREALAVAVLPAVLLTAFTLWTPGDIGIRYLLPVIALWLVVASPVVRAARYALGQMALAAVVGVAAVMTVMSSPSSLAWVNPQFAPAYQAASNSSVDWGQDFYRLQQWAPGKHPWVGYFGRGLTASDVPGGRPLLSSVPNVAPRLVVNPRHITGWVAVSATSLTSENHGDLSWLRAYCPVGDLGGTILVYRFATPPVVTPGPTKPASECRGSFSHRRPA